MVLALEMLNFGALIAFMGVNLAAFVRYNVREAKKSPILPALLTLVIIAIGVWPGSNMTAYAVAGVCLLISRPDRAAARRFHDLLFPLEEPQLESMDRRWHLDAGWHRRSAPGKRAASVEIW